MCADHDCDTDNRRHASAVIAGRDAVEGGMSDVEKLNRLIDELVKDVDEMTDDEILAEAEPGEIERVRAVIESAIEKVREAS